MNKEEFIAKENLLADLEYNLISDFISKRKNANLTQEELASKSNSIRATINRIENSLTSPTIGTTLKILEPLGFTLKIVPLKKKN